MTALFELAQVPLAVLIAVWVVGLGNGHLKERTPRAAIDRSRRGLTKSSACQGGD